MDSGGDEDAFQLLEERVRAAHELRRGGAGGHVHDAAGEHRQALQPPAKLQRTAHDQS